MNLKKNINPIERFWLLLKPNNKEIRQIYTLSFFIGLVGLSLPLGIQAIVNLIQGGQVSVSFVILILIVVLGIILSGYMQVMQLRITENIQQTLFTKAAFDFALRIPNIKAEALHQRYAPELMNRFFDIGTIQKGLSKILIEFSTATLQILFGLILLSLYHPIFIVLSSTVILIIYLILKYTGKKGLETSITESNYKYKVAYWLQELAKANISFKLVGKTKLPGSETDKRVSNHLEARENHYMVLKQQMVMLIGFKVFIATCLLSIGGILVINQQMNIGQFIAAELIILLVLGSVEKIILCLETIYDVLTALEKIGQVSDLELENTNFGNIFSPNNPIDVELVNVSFKYPQSEQLILDNINLKVSSGEKICLTGNDGSGKSTLMRIISGQYAVTNGNICFNSLPVGNYNITSVRKHIGFYLNDSAIFNGTIADNISMGRENIELDDIIYAAEKMYLMEFIKQLPKGLDTKIYSNGEHLPKSVIQKILLARSIVQKPKLLLLEDCFDNIKESQRIDIIDYLFGNEFNCTIITTYNDPYLIKKCFKTFALID